MSVLSEINRIKSAVTAIINAIKNKGVAVPTNAKITDLAPLINSISTGGGGASVETGTVYIDFGNFHYVLEDKTILIAFTQSGRGNVLSYSRSAHNSNNVTIENVHLNSPLVICFPFGGWGVSTTPNFQSGNTCIYYPSLIQGDTKNVYFYLDD